MSDGCRYLFDQFKKRNGLHSRIYQERAKTRIHQIPYLNDDAEYSKFKAAAEIPMTFHWKDLGKMISSEMKKNYDIMYLSCIHGNFSNDQHAKRKQLIQLEQHLNPGGIIFANYAYNKSDFLQEIREQSDAYANIPGFHFKEHKCRTIKNSEDIAPRSLSELLLNVFLELNEVKHLKYDVLSILTKVH